MIIGLNCGHTLTGIGRGAVGYIDESIETRRLGGEIANILRTNGHTVIDCTNDSAQTVNNDLRTICSMSNKQYVDLFVSIHFNAGKGIGAEVLTYGGKQLEPAKRVLDKLSFVGFRNRGIKDGSNLYVLKHTNAKSILVEVCFVDTKTDVELYKENFKKIAKAIAEGITGENYIMENKSIFSDVSINDYAYEDIKRCHDYGIINGYEDGTFKPDKQVTRKEMAMLISRALRICGK